MAALVIPGTVAFSYAGAFGLSVLLWQHLIGLHLHWLILPLTFIILVAVGSDYNLPVNPPVKEELHARLHTGLIRALGSTGWCGDVRGFVFAFTHAGDALERAQDHRSDRFHGMHRPAARHADRAFVVVPCILSILGKWFWWPTLAAFPPSAAALKVAVRRRTNV